MVAETIAEVAKLLFMTGVPIDGVHCADWREGDLGPLAGQAIALKKEMRRLYKTPRPDKAPLNKELSGVIADFAIFGRSALSTPFSSLQAA